MSSYENITGLTDAFEVSNSLADGMIAIGVPLLLWIALFGWNVRKGRAEAITYASLATGIVLLLENIAGLVEYWVIIADLILFALGLFMMFNERKAIEV